VRLRGKLAAAAAVVVAATPALAAAAPHPDARAYLVLNPATGDVLLRHHARERVPIASITKLMTVLVTLEHAKPSDVVTVAAAATSVGESSIYLRRGERLTVLDLVKAALIQSANDAAVALAVNVGGSVGGFVQLMNAKAHELGLTDTHFENPDGLDAPGLLGRAGWYAKRTAATVWGWVS
jgi:D-alanyl-D-alanine carboxypeptidase